MIDWTEIPDGDTWELFARDFLSDLGFVAEIAPGRGPDGGRDLVVSEQLRGTLFSRKFSWLVSCKHFAKAGTAVGAQEVDITDRCRRNGTSGFVGFYSTMASAGLVDRLKDLQENGDLEAVEIFDHRRIEASVVAAGMTKVVLRYLPTSYGRLRPIQRFFEKYTGLNCDVCHKDVLASSVDTLFATNIISAKKSDKYDSVYVACKEPCDRILSERLAKQGYTTDWEDLSDLCNPLLYVKNMMSYMNHLHSGHPAYSPDAHKRIKDIYLALAQRTLREVTKEDEERFKELRVLDGL